MFLTGFGHVVKFLNVAVILCLAALLFVPHTETVIGFVAKPTTVGVADFLAGDLVLHEEFVRFVLIPSVGLYAIYCFLWTANVFLKAGRRLLARMQFDELGVSIYETMT